jgi:NAD(P)H-hydrate repair Nnr-like enzyme with NAD(P)H-hydrate dehydratase domain
MKVLSRLRSAFSKRQKESAKAPSDPESEVFLAFANTGEVIQAESFLKAEGLAVRVMAPPPALRTGCDMVLVVSLAQAFRAVGVLKKHGIAPLQMTPTRDPLLAPMSLFQTRDYGNWFMVRAANMKLTVEKSSGRIVNVSGGGCPDVPYLAARLIGKHSTIRRWRKNMGRHCAAMRFTWPRRSSADSFNTLADKPQRTGPMRKETSSRPRPWLFVGTIPDADFPCTLSPFTVRESELYVGAKACPVHRGSPAMLAAAACTWARVQPDAFREDLLVLAAGDTGGGEVSREVYRRLVEILPELCPRGLVFHYLLPDVDWHNRILMAVEELPGRPVLVADAGYMYAAKMSGYAESYDLFTPDIGELAFLADESAPHPFYTRNFLLADEEQAENLLAMAYAGNNAARHMLVKGKVDRYAHNGKVLAEVAAPDVPMLEPIGGTGDTLTGIVGALLASGTGMGTACAAALRINRRMGFLAGPTPASSIAQILDFLPAAVDEERNTLLPHNQNGNALGGYG